MRSPLWLITCSLLLLAGAAAPLRAQDTPSEESMEFFKRNCASCHTIGGGRLAGPDLKNVLDRRDRACLAEYITDPRKMIDSGDAYARKLLEEARGTVMPTLPGMDRKLAEKLITLIAAESKLEKSHFAGLQISDRPLTPQDVVDGEALFTGTRAFKSGAPHCNSCHTVGRLAGLGGGALGPDLSTAFARLEGRKALAAWLSAPPSAVMAPVFRNYQLDGEEILSLVAFLKASAEAPDPLVASTSITFLLCGVGGAALLLITFDLLWRRRFVGVRRSMVKEH